MTESQDRQERDDYLEGVLIGGREPPTMTLAAPDPAWASRFALERSRIVEALGAAAILVEHIGSTAVPGLAAKPIVDIVVTVRDVGDEAGYVHRLLNAGYELRVREHDHLMFRTPERDVHVHVYSHGHDDVAAYLKLRDRLRSDEADRARYEQVKRDLLALAWRDVNDYADAKTSVIQEILANVSQAPRAGA